MINGRVDRGWGTWIRGGGESGVEGAGSGSRGGGKCGGRRGGKILQMSQRSETFTKILMPNLPASNYFACFSIY